MTQLKIQVRCLRDYIYPPEALDLEGGESPMTDAEAEAEMPSIFEWGEVDSSVPHFETEQAAQEYITATWSKAIVWYGLEFRVVPMEDQ